MDEFEDAAERRRKKAEYIDHRVRDMIWRAIMMNFRLTYGEYFQEIMKRNKKLKKNQIADANRDDDMEAWLTEKANTIAEQTSKHIVNFLREQIVKQDQ